VTKAAKRKLESFLNKTTHHSDTALRMVPSSSMDKDVEFVLDEREASDQVIEGEDGDLLLLIGEDWDSDLDELVLDYRRDSDGARFVIEEAP
jgi:Fe-S cluster assembly iron-binding protein IscA